MEAVEGDPGVGKMLPLSLPAGGGQVHADLPDPVRMPPVGLQIFSEDAEGVGFPSFGGEEHAGPVQVHRAEVEWLQLVIGLFLVTTVFQSRFGKGERTFRVRLWHFLPAGLGA